MRIWQTGLLGLLVTWGVLLAPDPLTVGALPEKEIWSGKSDGFTIHWTPKDIRAIRLYGPGQVVYSLRGETRRTHESWSREWDEPGACTLSKSAKVLSVVGPYLSMRHDTYSYCKGAAHPALLAEFKAMDLRQPEKEITLTDIFPDDEVLKALLNDPIVKRTLGEDSTEAQPKTTAQLLQMLSDKSLEHRKCEYAFDNGLLKRFAFHHVSGNRVAVRLSLSHGYEVCRGMLTELGIYLPVPQALKPHVEAARQRQAGFLMDHLSRISRSKQATVVEFSGL